MSPNLQSGCFKISKSPHYSVTAIVSLLFKYRHAKSLPLQICRLLVRKWICYVMLRQMQLPSLCRLSFWQQSGRDELLENELITLKDSSDTQLCLSPTCEEMISFIVSNANLITSQLPIAVYQIGSKFRDERRPKHGLLRSREFVMKDMYSFHSSSDQCKEFYEATRSCYVSFFRDAGFKFGTNIVEVEAPSGAMGGNLSHEFHVLAKSGEDVIHKCEVSYWSSGNYRHSLWLFGHLEDWNVLSSRTLPIRKISQYFERLNRFSRYRSWSHVHSGHKIRPDFQVCCQVAW